MVTDGSRLFVTSISGFVTCYEVTTGRVLWEFDVGRTRSLFYPPVLDGDRLYVGALDGSLTSLDVSGPTPRLEWREQTDTIRTSIAVGVTPTHVIGSNFRGSLQPGLAGLRR
jgi:outer membrane protein assembly factor BamB